MELVAPIPGREPEIDPEALTLDDFAVDERTGRVEACPQGHTPLVVERDEEAGTTRIEMAPEVCARMPLPQRLPDPQDSGRPLHLGFHRQGPSPGWAAAGTRDSGVHGAVRATLGHRVDQQRLEESAGIGAAEGAGSRERVPCDPAQSGGLERAAGGGVEEDARLGERSSGPDAERRRIWAN